MTYTPEQISQVVLKVLKETDENPDVRNWIVQHQHSNTSQETLAVLVTDEDPNVRYLLAQNPNASQETLAILETESQDDSLKGIM